MFRSTTVTLWNGQNRIVSFRKGLSLEQIIRDHLPHTIMALDTETTGLPMNTFQPQRLEYFQSARLINLGYTIQTKDRIIKEVDFLIRPKDFHVPPNQISGITQEEVDLKGISLENCFTQLKQDLTQVDLVVAHNLQFDRSILLSEAYRIGDDSLIQLLQQIPNYCTMIHGKGLKLSTLYQNLCGETVNQNHRALEDARLCARCYWNLLN